MTIQLDILDWLTPRHLWNGVRTIVQRSRGAQGISFLRLTLSPCRVLRNFSLNEISPLDALVCLELMIPDPYPGSLSQNGGGKLAKRCLNMLILSIER